MPVTELSVTELSAELSELSSPNYHQAAYSGREVTWEELLRSNEQWDSGIDVNKLG